MKLPQRPKGRPTAQTKEKYLKELEEFAKEIKEISKKVHFKLSSRGWCYQLEGFGLITKAEFDAVQGIINRCRKANFLPYNFVAEEEARSFDFFDYSTLYNPKEYLEMKLRSLLHCADYYEGVSFWDTQECYIEILVEKIDLKTLFYPTCRKYKVPIATSKGWSSIEQRGQMAERFRDKEKLGQKCVLLYCGDHDPDGLLISKKLKKNFKDLEKATDFDPENLTIERFGLNYEFILENNLTWIDNLITGSGKKPDKKKAYIKNYIEKYGERKCEANALVVIPDKAKELCENTIKKYLGETPLEDYEKDRKEQQARVRSLQEELRLSDIIRNLTEKIQNL